MVMWGQEVRLPVGYWFLHSDGYRSVPVGGWPDDGSFPLGSWWTGSAWANGPSGGGGTGGLEIPVATAILPSITQEQGMYEMAVPEQGLAEVAGLPAGADLRDYGLARSTEPWGMVPGGGQDGRGAVPGGDSAIPGPVMAAVQAIAAQRGLRTFGAVWNFLPGWVKAALLLVGITAASVLIIRGIRGRGDGGLPSGGDVGGLPGVQVVGTWIANGVQFYRLADGRLAVQNKRGRWKVWRPKKPIILFSTGAKDLRTLLRADAVLNREAKKIRRMLDRRVGGARRAPRAAPQIIVAGDDVITGRRSLPRA